MFLKDGLTPLEAQTNFEYRGSNIFFANFFFCLGIELFEVHVKIFVPFNEKRLKLGDTETESMDHYQYCKNQSKFQSRDPKHYLFHGFFK